MPRSHMLPPQLLWERLCPCQRHIATSSLNACFPASQTLPPSSSCATPPLGPCPPLQAALAEKGISEPTEIQAAAVPALLRDRSSDFMLASHTGSGKTLAYLLPVGACALAPVLAVLCLGW